MRLGKMMRLARALDGRDVRTVGAEIGISASTVSRIENDKACDLKSLGKVLAWLLADDGPASGHRATAASSSLPLLTATDVVTEELVG
jgi:transcriptional regulator with XRE-family HTH domain